MYSNSHSHSLSGGFRICFQRFLCSYRCLVTIVIVFLFSIFLYYYNESLTLLKTQEIQGSQCQQKLDSISAQLQVVYEHKSRLEKALAADRDSCTKKMEAMESNLKFAKDGYSKSDAELKAVQKQQEDLQKAMGDLKIEKRVADHAAIKAAFDAESDKEVYTKEIEALKSENAKLNAQLINLHSALNRSYEQLALLQQQLEQQRPHGGVQAVHPPAAQKANQQQPAASGVFQQAYPAPPAVDSNIQQSPANDAVQRNAAFPAPQPQTPVPEPHAEQVALPMAEHRQQQLYAEKLSGPPAGPAPLPQRPVEGQQHPAMIRPNLPATPNVIPAPPSAPAAIQPAALPAPVAAPLAAVQQQVPVPPPAPMADTAAGQQNNSETGDQQNDAIGAAAPPPAPAVQGGGGGGGEDGGALVGFFNIEPQIIDHHFNQFVQKPGNEYKDGDEDRERRDIEAEQ